MVVISISALLKIGDPNVTAHVSTVVLAVSWFITHLDRALPCLPNVQSSMKKMTTYMYVYINRLTDGIDFLSLGIHVSIHIELGIVGLI